MPIFRRLLFVLLFVFCGLNMSMAADVQISLDVNAPVEGWGNVPIDTIIIPDGTTVLPQLSYEKIPSAPIGYNFNGFWSEPDGGVQYYDIKGTPVREYTDASITTLYAHWEPVSYTLVFNANGGSGVAPQSPDTCNYESCIVPENTFIAPDGYFFAGWIKFSQYTDEGVFIKSGDHVRFEMGDNTDYYGALQLSAKWCPNGTSVTEDGRCVFEPEFTITTTDLKYGDVFQFNLSAAGNYVIDWGDYTDLQVINKTDTTDMLVSHKFNTDGAITIKIMGQATAYSDSIAAIRFEENDKIAAVGGSLGAIFGGTAPNMFNSTFYKCTNLTEIPENLFSGVTGSAKSQMFRSTFNGCTNIKSVPANLFDGISGAADGMFRLTFYNCTSLESVPEHLFGGDLSGAAERMFHGVFFGTKSLKTIPATLFSGISGGAKYLFSYAFQGSGLTQLPSGLFSNVTSVQEGMFEGAFIDCSELGGHIPSNTFAGINGVTNYTSGPMYQIFKGTALATTCPDDMEQYITGFEADWSNRVACAMTSCNDKHMLIDGTCVEPEFTITTTEMSAGTTFSFKMSASGVFYVDFDDGRGVQKIDRTNNTSNTTYTSAAYSTAGTHTIKMYGDATGYTTSSSVAAISFKDNKNIKTVDGSLGAIFGGNTPYMFHDTFYYCTSLQSIPADLSSGVTGSSKGMFSNTFFACKSLRSIPAGLFSGVTGSSVQMFYYTFSDCTSLQSIPAGLFSGVTGSSDSMFHGTFYDCTSLQSIPADLFSGVTGSSKSMFSSTFSGCTSLTSLPDGLFKNIEGKPATDMFSYTFRYCVNLSGYIPADTFAKMDSTDFDSATMRSIFANTALDTSCPAGTTQYSTGFESAWNRKVACTPCPDGVCSKVVPCSNEIGSGEHTCYFDANTGDYTNCDETCDIVSCNDKHMMVDGTCVACPLNSSSSGGNSTSCTCNENATVTGFAGGNIITTTNACKLVPEFTITTTDTASRFSFDLSAAGTYWVDWGDGTEIEKIEKQDTETVRLAHEFITDGAHTISMRGDATEYTNSGSVINFATEQIRIRKNFGTVMADGNESIAKLGGSLGAIFSQAVPNMFYNTCDRCISLIEIPSTLFAGISGVAEDMFNGTFSDCTGLTKLPNGLFKNISGMPVANMFAETFSGCSNITGYVPVDLFSDKLEYAPNVMTGIFNNTSLETQCESGMYQYKTGFEADWNSKVACTPCPDGLKSGVGATSVNECGSVRTLHIGENDTMQLLSVRPSASPMLVVEIDGNKYFGQMSMDSSKTISSESDKHFIIEYNDKTYYLHDFTMQ